MADLEKLAMDHAYWADKVRQEKKAGEQAAAACIKGGCIDPIFQVWGKNEGFNEDGSRSISFEEAYSNACANGAVCNSCQAVRRHRAERMKARRQLGHIRSAITNAGRALKRKKTNG